MNCSANTPVQLSFFSESLNTIACSANDRRRSAAAAMDRAIRDRGWKKGEGYKYSDGKTKASVICPNGHRLEITPKDFKGGNGCAKCSGRCPDQAKEDFEQAIQSRKYSKCPDYVYSGSEAKVFISCPKGHRLEIKPSGFKRGAGCAKCAGQCPQEARLTFEQAIAQRGFSKDKDYFYVNSRARVSLTCPKGHHFKAMPCTFRRSRIGCPKCAGLCPQKAQEELEKVIQDRGYSKDKDFDYAGSATKISLVCPNGHPLKIKPNSFKRGDGCAKCSGYCVRQAQENFERLIEGEGYLKGAGYAYTRNKAKVPLICPSGHHFQMRPNSFNNGERCPACVSSGFNQCIPAILYYIAFYPSPDRAVYKIGITNRTVAERYQKCKTPYRILMEKHFESGLDCREEESMLIRKHYKHRCKDTPVDGLGNKELFDIDVLGLDVEL